MKLTINDPENGRSYSLELDASKANILMGKKIGDKVDGNDVNLPGYELKITGGSSTSGLPMRADIQGIRNVKILSRKGAVGVKKARKGDKVRKTVTGNTISQNTSQVNMTVLKKGAKPLDEILVKKEEKKEEK